MLKYNNCAVTFSEVPDEVCLYITITNCPIRCKDCNSKHLWEDVGNILDEKELFSLLEQNKGISCVVFGGGDSEPETINILASNIKNKTNLKVCWYSGSSKISDKINLYNFDYIKIGPFDSKCGPLTSKTTNQTFYKLVNSTLIDWTNKFWK